jgi:hypothetical protein
MAHIKPGRNVAADWGYRCFTGWRSGSGLIDSWVAPGNQRKLSSSISVDLFILIASLFSLPRYFPWAVQRRSNSLVFPRLPCSSGPPEPHGRHRQPPITQSIWYRCHTGAGGVCAPSSRGCESLSGRRSGVPDFLGLFDATTSAGHGMAFCFRVRSALLQPARQIRAS